MSAVILRLPTPFVYTRAYVEARLAEARKARGRAYTAEARDHAITEYLAAIRDRIECDLREADRG